MHNKNWDDSQTIPAEAHQIYGMQGILDEHTEGHTNRFLSQCHVLKEQDSDKMLNTCAKELSSRGS
jgi:hypothetical protein